MKINPEISKFDRIRMLVGTILTIFGVFTILGLGIVMGYDQPTLWVAGFLFIIGGIFIAKSVELANFLNNILRF